MARRRTADNRKPWNRQRAQDALVLRLLGPRGKRKPLKPTPSEKIVYDRVRNALGITLRLYQIRLQNGQTVYQCGGHVPGRGAPQHALSAQRRGLVRIFVDRITGYLLQNAGQVRRFTLAFLKAR